MENIEFKLIPAEQTFELRHRVLREHSPGMYLKFEEDALEETFHIGAFTSQGELIGVVSLYNQGFEPPKESGLTHDKVSPIIWRLRGMAVAHAYQGQGIGAKMLKCAQQEIKNRTPEKGIWRNARVKALNVYKRNGFEVCGKEFPILDIGAHYVLICPPQKA